MSKKSIGIITTVVIAIIVIVIAITALNKDKDQNTLDGSNTTVESTDNPYGIDTETMSKNLNMSEDELKEVLDTELDGDAAQAVYDSQAVPEIDYIIPESITDDGRYEAVDKDGNVYEVDDPFAGMTEEELAEYNAKMDEIINAYEEDDGTTDITQLMTEAKDIINQSKYPEPDQELIDAGFVATRDPNSDTGWSYENPNVVESDVDKGTSQMPSYREIITDSSQIDSGMKNIYENADKVTIGYGEDIEDNSSGNSNANGFNNYKPGGSLEIGGN